MILKSCLWILSSKNSIYKILHPFLFSMFPCQASYEQKLHVPFSVHADKFNIDDEWIAFSSICEKKHTPSRSCKH